MHLRVRLKLPNIAFFFRSKLMRLVEQADLIKNPSRF